MNTHEQYVSFLTAKLLKQAGYDWETEHYYSTYGSVEEPNNGRYDLDYNSFGDEFYSAPTQAVAMRWLREVKGYCVEATAIHGTKYMGKFYIQKDSREFSVCDGYQIINDLKEPKKKLFDTYESAIEETIQICIEMILEEK